MLQRVYSSRYLVVGGHGRGVGKTALVEDLLRAFPGENWAAVKITPHAHGSGVLADKGDKETGFSLEVEHEPGNRTDTARYLASGAARALLLRYSRHALGRGIKRLCAELGTTSYVILESNAALEYLHPTFCIFVLEPAIRNFKESARRWLELADAFLLRQALGEDPWKGVPLELIKAKPRFLQPFGEPLPADLLETVRERMLRAQGAKSKS